MKELLNQIRPILGDELHLCAHPVPWFELSFRVVSCFEIRPPRHPVAITPMWLKRYGYQGLVS